MKRFYNFLPTKAEEESSRGQAAVSTTSSVSIREIAPATLPLNYLEAGKWAITIVMTASDVEGTYKLTIPQDGTTREVQDNILCYLQPQVAANVMSCRRGIINMKDVDTGNYIADMTLSREEPNSNNFYIQGHWKKQFIVRRKLRVGHQIGLRWNVEEHCLEFSKLN